MDWEGREFNVLAYDSERNQFDNFEIYAESENGDVVNDAIFRRNTAIEDKYNVKIKQTMTENSDWTNATLSEFRRSTLAAENIYDLAFVSLGSVGTAAREGLFADLYDADYINFSKDWWNPEVNETLELNGRLFFTTSDFSLRDKNRTYILVYNTNLVEDFKLGSPVELVRSGDWTFDTVAEWTKAVAGDLNGNSEIDPDDRFGIVSDSYHGFTAFFTGMDNFIMNQNNGNLEITIATEHAVNTVERILSISEDPQLFMYPEDWKGKVEGDHWGISSETFYAGRALFATSFVHSLQNYSAKCTDNYGIIPYPKYDEEQEGYYALADIHSMVFGIPTQALDPDFSGFMLEALSHGSTNTSLNAYYEIAAKTKYTYDPDSAEMLDVIFDGIRYDLGTIYKISGLDQFFYKFGGKASKNFTSDFAAIKTAAEEDIKKLTEDLAG